MALGLARAAEVYTIDVGAWGRFFESIGAAEDPLLVSVSLLRGSAEDAPAQRPKERPLRAIRYDSERDVLQLAVGGTVRRPELRYFISGPRRILVEESVDQQMIVVEDSTQARTAISMRGRSQGASDTTPLAGMHSTKRTSLGGDTSRGLHLAARGAAGDGWRAPRRLDRKRRLPLVGARTRASRRWREYS